MRKAKKYILITFITASLFAVFFIVAKKANSKIISIYNERKSIIITDRNDEIIHLKLNPLGYYAEYLENIPDNLKKQLLEKEDKYFYYHPGINPFSILRAFKNYLSNNKNLSSSAITQQLAKILLANENKRTLKNKIKESFYAVSLEAFLSKEEILKMYCNSIFLGNSTQGIKSASRLYFNKEVKNLTEEETARLVSAISNPSNKNPFKGKDINLDKIKSLKSNFASFYKRDVSFEINSLDLDFKKQTKISIDQNLTKNFRDILKRNLQALIKKNALNGALAVIKLPENEILSIVGSPSPDIDAYGYKINMAEKPRPIGSTIKPFIYLKGFEKNLRPYTIVEDKEYKYTIGTGFAFYPKNYDYKYRGEVSLHYSLSNSLNVPTVKVLEYAGLEDFYEFLLNDLEFEPVQNLENYQLGIALGGLEMDLMSLCRYFTIFPNEGVLKTLKITDSNLSQSKKIAEKPFIQLINKILSDRVTGVEQFGAKSNLNLYADNYAVKTGTSRDYHDSWTIGYTPDFLVGVWVGNSGDSPMDKVSGQTGAGQIWNEAMNLLINSKYNKKTEFNFNLIKEFTGDAGIAYGLPNDDFSLYQNLMKNTSLIIAPHNNDIFLFEEEMKIPLKASRKSDWHINNDLINENSTEIIFSPSSPGRYKIKASSGELEEIIKIFIEAEE